MSTIARIDTFVATLRKAYEAGLSAAYRAGTPKDKLVTLTGNVYDLCWEIAAHTKHSAPTPKMASVGNIKYRATNIVNICITELENLGHTTEDTIELIAADGALWFWNLPLQPLGTLDRDTPPVDRIQSLQISTGHLMEWWPNMLSPQNEVDLNAERERAFISLAYEATCAIIAHTH